MVKPITDEELAEFGEMMSDENYALEKSAEGLVMALRERLRLAEAVLEPLWKWGNAVNEECLRARRDWNLALRAYRAATRGEK